MKTILLVDDIPELLRLNTAVLSRCGHTILTASSAPKALTILTNERVDLAIIDVQMPYMDGMTLLKRIRQLEDYQHLPVVMLTAADSDKYAEESRSYHVHAILQKPVSSKLLRGMVEEVLTANIS